MLPQSRLLQPTWLREIDAFATAGAAAALSTRSFIAETRESHSTVSLEAGIAMLLFSKKKKNEFHSRSQHHIKYSNVSVRCRNAVQLLLLRDAV